MRVIAIAMVGIFLVPQLAAADPGWILWKKTEVRGVQGKATDPNQLAIGEVTWSPEDGAETYAQCKGSGEGAAAGTVKVYRGAKIDGLTVDVTGPTSLVLTWDHLSDEKRPSFQAQFLSFICFPGTFDPRISQSKS